MIDEAEDDGFRRIRGQAAASPSCSEEVCPRW